jgi:hypothetical protein
VLPRGGKPTLDSLAGHFWTAGKDDNLVPAERVLACDVRPHQPRAEEDDLHLPTLPLATDRTERQPAHEVPLHQEHQNEDRCGGDH